MSSQQNSQSGQIVQGRWDGEEHLRFLAGIMLHGKDWKTVEKVVKSRTGSQVRSHAQKFFIKLTKIAKERKKCKNRQLMQPSEIEREILTNFTTRDFTENTPSEIVNLINKDWEEVALGFNHKKKQPRTNRSALKQPTPESPPEDPEEEVDIFVEDVHNNKIDAADSNDDSFFIKIYKKNKQHFKNANDFRELIDFGKNHHQETQHTQAHHHQRKKSFCLPHMEDNSPKLKETLESIHRAMDQR